MEGGIGVQIVPHILSSTQRPSVKLSKCDAVRLTHLFRQAECDLRMSY